MQRNANPTNYMPTSSNNHQPPESLHLTVASRPFDAWGLDVVEPITPKSSIVHIYILAATDYFPKWVEAIPLKEVKKETIVNFIHVNIILAFLTVNGLAKAVDKTLCNLLKKIVSKSKRDWHRKIGEALWAYRTTHRSATQATPYSLVYGVEVVLPLESQIPSLCITIQEGLTVEDNACLRLEELKALDEKRIEAQQQIQFYQAPMTRVFNKKVQPRSFQVI
ncbi:hypothetical protein Sango_2097600 [Sesamum angolense]|uniref:Uncharacterized protein n=1 Tax=Sesamum angolense TaxID=2727404 RepID=A0AAE1WBI8_9LAMI|nr:hypothetical protein Sango_2097600 [Sesamum angolense]